MAKLPRPRVVAKDALDTTGLPEHVQVALEEIAASAREGVLALSVACGLAVVSEIMAADVTRVCGPRGKHDPDRTALPAWRRVAADPARRCAHCCGEAADAFQRRGGSAALLRAVRALGSAGRDGARPDARGAVHAALPSRRRPGGRRAASGRLAVDDLAPLPPRHPGQARGAVRPGPRRPGPAGCVHR